MPYRISRDPSAKKARASRKQPQQAKAEAHSTPPLPLGDMAKKQKQPHQAAVDDASTTSNNVPLVALKPVASSSSDAADGVPRRASSRLSKWLVPYTIDLRALAFFRICVGIVVIHDLHARVSHFSQFYSEGGVWPLKNHIRDLEGEMIFSLFFACHHDWWQAIVFVLSFVVAAMYLVGWHTRQVKWLNWICMMSMQNRILLGSSGGDDLLISCVFWGLFMPIEERWSVDAALRKTTIEEEEVAATLTRSQRNTHLSVASAAFNIQPIFMYVFTGLLKTGKEWYPDCTALYYALSGIDYVRPFGIWLRQTLPYESLKWLTLSALVLEFGGGFLLLSPWSHPLMRTLGVISYVGFHIGIFVTLALGNFQFICSIVLLTLLPRQAWDKFEKTLNAAGRNLDALATPLKGRVLVRLIEPTLPASASAHERNLATMRFDEQLDFWEKTQNVARYTSAANFDLEIVSAAPIQPPSVIANGSTNGHSAILNGSSSVASSSLSVVDERDKVHTGHAAFLVLASRTLPLRLLASLGLEARDGSVLGLALLPISAWFRSSLNCANALSWFHSFFVWSPRADAAYTATGYPRRISLVRNLVCAAFLVYVLIQNLSTVHKLSAAYPILKLANKGWGTNAAMLFKLDQRWAMFAPSPYTRVSWTVLRGKLNVTSGPARYVDVETLRLDSTPSFDRPALLSSKYSNVYFYDFVDDMEGEEEHYHPWSQFYCKRWNDHFRHTGNPQHQLLELELHFVSHNTTLPEQVPTPIEREHAWTQDCAEQYLKR